MKPLEDAAILRQILGPGIQVQLVEPIATALADCELFVVLIVFDVNVDLRVNRLNTTPPPPSIDAPFHIADLLQDALGGEAEGVRRAFQTLEQVHPQHGGEVVLPRALIEAELLAFGVQFGLVHQVRGRRVHGQAQPADALVQVVVGELALAVRWRVAD